MTTETKVRIVLFENSYGRDGWQWELNWFDHRLSCFKIYQTEDNARRGARSKAKKLGLEVVE